MKEFGSQNRKMSYEVSSRKASRKASQEDNYTLHKPKNSKDELINF
jgi:hypothetical protein